jgi:TonB-linked SusC/RagA family outer membrane protein
MRSIVKATLLLLVWVLGATSVWAQTGSIRGTVRDGDTGEPLPGANVYIPSLNNLGASTGAEGDFIIEAVPTGTHLLVARFVGFQNFTQEVTVPEGGEVVVDIVLETDYLGLDEVVVVGYGTQDRRQISGAVSTLRPENVEDIPTPSINNALQGRIAGVQVSQNSGNPGAAITVRVRGATSITAGNEPLYVIDGVPVNQGSYSRLEDTFGGQTISALADLNPNEIESIEVLKDASAAAIYGSRASNGVVLITTKRGREGRPRIDFNAFTGVQEAWRVAGMLNAEQYVDLYNESIFNEFGVENYFGFTDDGVENDIEVDRSKTTDWLDEVLRTAPMSNISLGITGGTERTRYYVNGTIFDQGGLVRSFGYERLNGRMNLDYYATDKLSFGTSVSLARSVIDRGRGDNTIYGPFANAIAEPPTSPVYNDDGTYYSTNYANPVGLMYENEAEERSVRIIGSTFANYEITRGVDARVSVGVDHLGLRSRLYDSPIVGLATGSDGSGTAANTYASKVMYEGTVNFARLIANRHDVSGVVGTSFEENTEEFSEVTGTQFPGNQFRYLTSAATITDGSSLKTEWTLFSIFSRLSYTYNGKYTATFNVRRDGSSRFGEDNRYGLFPSASASWLLSEEPFLRENHVVSSLKLRASYGITGNQYGIGNFDSRGLWSGGENYGDRPGIAPTQLANPDLRWETTAQFDVGTDFSLLNDRISVTADYYVKNTDDLLLNRPIPSTTGFEVLTSNVGSMKNYGYELGVRAQIVRGSARGFRWTADFNIARNFNRVTGLVDDEPIMTGFASRIEVGQPLGVFYGYKMEGIFQTQEEIDAHASQPGAEPGDVKFADLNGDGVITADDRTVIGNPWPDYTGGMTNTLSWKGFDLSVFLQFSAGNDIFNGNRIYQDAFGYGYFDNASIRALDRWTPENTDTDQPRASYSDPNNNARTSSRFVEDGSYLRLKNVVFGYALPESLSSRLGFRNLRLYVQGQNLLTFTSYSGFDPEVNYAGNTAVVRGTDFYTMPQARSYTLGVSIGL